MRSIAVFCDRLLFWRGGRLTQPAPAPQYKLDKRKRPATTGVYPELAEEPALSKRSASKGLPQHLARAVPSAQRGLT